VSSLPASAFIKGRYALANLLYHPVKDLMWGVELQRWKRENQGDGEMAIFDDHGVPTSLLVESSGDLRVQLSFQ
jgi:hypothetical protein